MKRGGVAENAAKGWDCGDCPYKKPWASMSQHADRYREALERIVATEGKRGYNGTQMIELQAIARKALS